MEFLTEYHGVARDATLIFVGLIAGMLVVFVASMR